ncbi:MAG TPA: histidine phosphatase family protein [Candidatus Saccharimonadales bacterium]
MRHGQSQANANRIVAGHQDSPLSLFGREQAARAGMALQRTLAIDLVVSSPMKRARQTAEIIATYLHYPQKKILILDNLEERHLGELEGKSYDETPYGNGNVEGAESVAGIEPIAEFYKRVKAALAIIEHRPEKTIVVVCHNGVGRMLQVIAKGDQPIDIYKHPRLQNGAVYPLGNDN